MFVGADRFLPSELVSSAGLFVKLYGKIRYYERVMQLVVADGYAGNFRKSFRNVKALSYGVRNIAHDASRLYVMLFGNSSVSVAYRVFSARVHFGCRR